MSTGAVGVPMSPGGQQLYVTTFRAYGPHGQLWVIDTARAETAADGDAVLTGRGQLALRNAELTHST